jgi:hypothetical protein
MPSPPRVRSIVSLVIAGILSTAVSLFGVVAGLWGGSKPPYPLLFACFWVLPALSLPVFGAYFFSRGVGKICSILLAVGIYATLFLLSWRDCAAGQCNTTSIVSIALGPLTSLSHLWGQIIASLFVNLASWERLPAFQKNTSTTEDPHL